MNHNDLPSEFVKKLTAITAKRARVVIDHLLEHGSITTEQIEAYGYKHPPRAIRDVREYGIPIVTERTKSSDGRTIALYRFGDPADIRSGQLQGRTTVSKQFFDALCERSNGKCEICRASFEKRYLQTDHRIPYEIAGDDDPLDRQIDDYILLCGSCNRAKSWSCEHCPNWAVRDETVCKRCYWAHPEQYDHIALRIVRRVDILWDADEIEQFEALQARAETADVPLPDYVKTILNMAVQNLPKADRTDF